MTTMDESLYSRQLLVLGKDAMELMQQSRVLISGLNGAGLELAKCIILGGVKGVTLHDTNNLSFNDFSGNYYASEENIGKNRLDSVSQLLELNPYVAISKTTEDLTEDLVKKHQVFVVSGYMMSEQQKFNNIARKNNVKFVAINTFGVTGQIFCDFGDEFVVKDNNGEEPSTGIITNSLFGENTVISTAEPHNLSSSDVIQVSNNVLTKQYNVRKVIDRTKFSINESFEFGKGNLANVNFVQVKQRTTVKFSSMDASIDNPSFVITNMADFDRPQLLHNIYRALNNYFEKNNRLPKTWNDDDCKEMVALLQNYTKEYNAEVAAKLIKTLDSQLCAIHAIIGSIAAQEVMKACSGKFNPITQWLYFDDINVIPDNMPSDTVDNTRYMSQISLFGKEFQDNLAKQKVFIVGAGAIGCEHIKNFSMSGIGNMVITDMDTIEKSNLNRQFLFRNYDIGQPKSTTAAKAAMKINPLVNVVAHQNKVGVETTNIYDEKFFTGLTCVANALDNVDARVFVDGLCVLHKKPLLESGTLGAKGNVQTIIPHMTQSYASTRDPPEQSVPICTLKHFPYNIEHCIQYGRDFFEGLFTKTPQNAIDYFNNPETIKKMTPTEVHSLGTEIKKLLSNAPLTYDDCIKYGFNTWHELFRDEVVHLTNKFPANHKTEEGADFWSGAKKFPTALEFDVENADHVSFVESYANLWADVFGINHMNDLYVINTIKTLQVPESKVSTKNISVTDDEEKQRQLRDIEITVDNINEILPPRMPDHVKCINTISFEKDDDTNFHINFITAVSNLRATNYRIPTADRQKTKGIAGKIIPAIATTTSLVSGLVTLELFKVMQKKSNIESFRDTFLNLAQPFFGITEPFPAQKQVIKLPNETNFEFTLWDSFSYTDMPVGKFIEEFQEKYNLEIGTLTCGQTILLSPFVNPKRKMERLGKTFKSLYKDIVGEECPTNPMEITILIDTDDDTEIDLPICKIYS
jgi:ubiquitin-activating enzyme E1